MPTVMPTSSFAGVGASDGQAKAKAKAASSAPNSPVTSANSSQRSSSSSSSNNSSNTPGKCSKEDNDPRMQRIVSPGVVLGATFRVVACACPLDPQLRYSSEWCEFCQCRKCGGKNLPKGTFASDGTGLDGEGGDMLGGLSLEAWLAAALTPDVCLFLALVGCAVSVPYYAQDRLHRYLYVVGAVAAAFLTRDVLVSRSRASR